MIEKFLDFLRFEKRSAPLTLKSYGSDLRQFSDFIKNTYGVNEFPENSDVFMIRSWLVSMVENGHKSASVNRKLSTLKSFFSFIIKIYPEKENPLEKVVGPKTEKKLPSFLQKEEAASLIHPDAYTVDFKGTRDLCVIEFLYATGLRLSELIQIRTTDIDHFSKQLKIIGKRRKERVLPLLPSLVAAVDTYIQAVHKTFDVATLDHGYLFVTDSGTKMYPKFVYRLIHSHISSVSSVAKKGPHTLRHTFATHLLDNGAELNVIKELLGHSSLAATQLYTHTSIERLMAAYGQAHPKA